MNPFCSILSMLPVRPPFMMFDRLIAIEGTEFIHVIKNVTHNDSFLQSRYAGFPLMPGSLIIESMAQSAAYLMGESSKQSSVNTQSIGVLAGLEKVRFKRPVWAGQQLHIQVRRLSARRSFFKFQAKALVDDVLVASAIISAGTWSV